MKAGQIAFPLRIPFVEELGLELWAFGDGQAELRVDLDEAHLNSWEVAHGGVLMTMLDVAMAHAARSKSSHSPIDAPGVVTLEMKTSFMRPGKGTLRALGTLLHKTATLAFTEGRVLDGDGQLCAHATATFKFLRALPSGGRQLQALQHNPDTRP
ncbi:MAG: PaaI family thioesterase [Rubrivivax sp.]|nr:PaaI family thioesterase [Rubrivivax sp.]